MLGKPPMDHYSTMAGKTQEAPPYKMFNSRSLLGWSCMVAPTSQTLGTQNPSDFDQSQVGIIHKLPGEKYATYQMAPTLCAALRFLLERRQVSPQNISLYLKKMEKLTS